MLRLTIFFLLTAVPLAGGQNNAEVYAQTGSIRGQIVDENEQPVGGVEILFKFLGGVNREHTAQSEEDGDFIRAGLPTGRYQLTFTKSGHQSYQYEVKVVGGPPTQLGKVVLPTLSEGARSDLEQQKLNQATASVFKDGVAAMIAEDFAAAIAAFEKVLEIDPDRSDALYNLGVAHENLGQMDQAVTLYKKADEDAASRQTQESEQVQQVQQVPPPAPAPRGSVTLNADEQEQIEKGHVKATGYVDMVSGDIRVSADKVDFWNEEMRVIAEGNVVFQQGDQKIVGDRMEVDLETGTGKFYNAYGSFGDGFYFQGDVVEKISEDVYVVERGAFTSCAQPTPRWRFTSGKATIRRDHHVSLHGAFLKVKSVPVFYVPYLYYPITEKDRSTGLMLPQIGNSTFKGFMVSQGFFWAINRSHDATINVDWFSQSGVGLGTEYRYLLSGASRGRFESYYIDDKVLEQREWQIRANVNQQLPADFTTIARVDYFSSFAFQQTYQESYEDSTRRSKRATVNVARSWSAYTLRFLYDRNETSFTDSISFREILPRVAFQGRQTKIGPTPILFGFSTSASSFSRSVRDDLVDYQRYDVLPTISYPFNVWPFLTARTSFITRFTRYSQQTDSAGEVIGDALDRTYSEVSVDVRGPTFSRIFNTHGSGYAEKYKHVIEPQLIWSYRSLVDNFGDIPKFDSNDYVPGTNQFSFSLVNRFLAKRKIGKSDKAVPYEFLTWTLAQRYFLQVDASLYDRQFSTPFFTEAGVPSNYSPVTSKLRFRPTGRLAASWNFEYDVNFNRMRSMSLVGSYGGGWGNVAGSYAQSVNLSSGRKRRNLRGITTLNATRTVQVRFQSAYDIETEELNLVRAGVNYNIQCCGFMAEWARYRFGTVRDENLFRVGITLANIGSFGTQLGGQGGRIQ